MYVKWSQEQCTRDNVSKIERKEKIQKSLLYTSYTHSHYHKISYTNPPPMSMITLISKLLPLFVTSGFTVASSLSPRVSEDESDDGFGSEDADEDDGASSPSDDEMST